MTKSTHSVRAERINTALGLIQKHSQLSEAAVDMVRHYGLSKRQAYRYLEMAKQLTEPIVVPDQKTSFTVKLSIGLIQQLRQHAELTGLTLSELVSQALKAFIQQGRGRG